MGTHPGTVDRLMSSESYRLKVASTRRFLDLYTLYEYAIWREDAITGTDAAVAETSVRDLWESSGIDGDLLRELQAMYAAACRDE